MSRQHAPYTKWVTPMVATLRQMYLAGAPTREIATALGVNEMAVRGRLITERRGPDPLPLRARPPKHPKPPKSARPLPPLEPEAPPAAPGWLCGASPEFLRLALAEGLGVSVEHAHVVEVLLRRSGERLSMAQLQHALGKHRVVKRGAMYERISLLRRVLGKDFIGGYRPPVHRFTATMRDLGESDYYLTEEGLQRCRVALNRAAGLLALHRVEESPPLRTTPQAAE